MIQGARAAPGELPLIHAHRHGADGRPAPHFLSRVRAVMSKRRRTPEHSVGALLPLSPIRARQLISVGLVTIMIGLVRTLPLYTDIARLRVAEWRELRVELDQLEPCDLL